MRELDRKKPFATVRGLPGIGYEQDGLLFNFHGMEIVNKVEVEPEVVVTPVEPKVEEVPKLVIPPAVETAIYNPPVIDEVETTPEMVADVANEDYKCPQCEFVGRSILSLRAHQRHWGH